MADEYGPWIAHNGGERPVDPDTIVQTANEQGVTSARRAGYWRWDDFTVAYRMKLEPVVKTVRQELTATETGVYWFVTESAARVQFKGAIVYETRDGIPDMTTLRWEDAD